MKIAVAQLQSYVGNIQKNMTKHIKFIQKAIQKQVDILIFPELSITAYEPTLAQKLALTVNDSHLDIFQNISQQHAIILGIGAPLRTPTGIGIGLILFHPNGERQVYTKKYLHQDEVPYFIAGENEHILIKNTSIALAICYELSIATHIETAIKSNASMYLASVAKTNSGMSAAHQRLSNIAATYQIPTMVGNCVGFCDNFQSVGKSAAWDKNGEILMATGTEEGILSYDTENNEVSFTSIFG